MKLYPTINPESPFYTPHFKIETSLHYKHINIDSFIQLMLMSISEYINIDINYSKKIDLDKDIYWEKTPSHIYIQNKSIYINSLYNSHIDKCLLELVLMLLNDTTFICASGSFNIEDLYQLQNDKLLIPNPKAPLVTTLYRYNRKRWSIEL